MVWFVQLGDEAAAVDQFMDKTGALPSPALWPSLETGTLPGQVVLLSDPPRLTTSVAAVVPLSCQKMFMELPVFQPPRLTIS